MDPRILERLRKLQAITPDRGATIDEAAAAAARLQALLTRYQLGMDDIPDASAPTEEPIDKEEHEGGRGWRHSLWCQLARINGGRGLYDMGRKRFVVVGTAATRASTVYLYAYAEREISRLRKAYVGTLDRWTRPIIAGNSFAAGAAIAFAARCKEARDATRADAPGTALVKVDRDAERATAAYMHMFPSVTHTRANLGRDGTAFMHGEAAGARMAMPGQGLPQGQGVRRLGVDS